jgi:cell pole-organizing protein PopZ
MTQTAKTPEPAIEEILTRVRRVLAEDPDTSALRPTESASFASDSAAPFSTQLSYSATPASHQQREPDLRTRSEDAGAAKANHTGRRVLAGAGENPGQLLSVDTSTAVYSAFNALAQSVLFHNGQTLDHIVGEMLRPILKAWLDDNLPLVVERLVRAEIERVSHVRP